MRSDLKLSLKSANIETITLALPLHGAVSPVLNSSYVAPLLKPDTDSWIVHMAGRIARCLREKPDLIYSRSYPFSAALLGRSLKKRLGVPWVMHLSDPWAGSPYRGARRRDRERDLGLERACVNDADAVAVTTEGQAESLRSRYPDRINDIFVSPNVMPQVDNSMPALPRMGEGLEIVYAGALYSLRRPTVLLTALRLLLSEQPSLAKRVTGKNIWQYCARHRARNIGCRLAANYDLRSCNPRRGGHEPGGG